MDRVLREIRAQFDDETITVYQAYGPQIADEALDMGRFGRAFKRERMTWIKPSFLWMMYRCGWARKPGQENVLAIRISREGFEWALRHSAFSHYDPAVHSDRQVWKDSLAAPVRIQWDPERDTMFRPLPYRSLQVGLSGEAVRRYCDEWIVSIDDVTEVARNMEALVGSGATEAALELAPVERVYPTPADIAHRLGMNARHT
ncbi:DUF4291 domain-containing protein [Nocardia cyriacigeorgica]|uniref:DUF4291 domain-containing protein n=1 Tax=Nocardia cyriacigeorgica TaxID=135487 RepID=UPI001487214E|nr:DUF4291 domain-containing protein [Nocardia cyriacigeorgica]